MVNQQASLVLDPALSRFARRLRETMDAQHVRLFGSRARGHAQPDSDYDLIVVSPQFDSVGRFHRGMGLRDMWYEEGGYGPMDIICLTPAEFERAKSEITLVAAVLPESIDLLAPIEAAVP